MRLSVLEVFLRDGVKLVAGQTSPTMNGSVEVELRSFVIRRVVKAQWHTFRESVDGRVIGWSRLGAVHKDRGDPLRTCQRSDGKPPGVTP